MGLHGSYPRAPPYAARGVKGRVGPLFWYTFPPMDPFQYFASESNYFFPSNMVQPNFEEARAHRAEMSEVLRDLRLQFGRRRLFRVDDVVRAARIVRARRECPDTEERPQAKTERKRLAFFDEEL